MNNLLIQSDNIYALRYLIEERGMAGKIDLIYTDPPFATNLDFKVSGGRSSTISHAKRGQTAYTDRLLGDDFLHFLRERLLMMHTLLSDKGSIYLHSDYKIGHYVRVMMDEVFGMGNFRNDITRIKCNPKNFPRVGYGNIKDMILFYSKGAHPIWHEPYQPYSEDDIRRLFPKVDAKGRRYTTVPIHAPGETANPQRFRGLLPPEGRHWRTDVATLEKLDDEGRIEWSSKGNPRRIIYCDDKPHGKRMQDVWTEWKDPQYPVYPTEKNMSFIDTIIRTSSDEGSWVLDPFCGSGTTLLSAQRNGRQWIGIDQSEVAIQATTQRLSSPGNPKPHDLITLNL